MMAYTVPYPPLALSFLFPCRILLDHAPTTKTFASSCVVARGVVRTCTDPETQAAAVLGIALVTLGDDIGSEMALRTFDHLLHYGELPIRRWGEEGATSDVGVHLWID